MMSLNIPGCLEDEILLAQPPRVLGLRGGCHHGQLYIYFSYLAKLALWTNSLLWASVSSIKQGWCQPNEVDLRMSE